MTRNCTLLALVLASAMLSVSAARAGTPCANYKAYSRSQYSNWHGQYYHTMWTTPVALVVPPTAGRHTKWGWGVTNTEVTPIYQQFGRSYPGPYYGGAAFLPTPIWPSHTDQFGVYYVRGPW